MEVGSGVASIVPGIGTAASVAIDAGLMARDAGAFAGPGASGNRNSKGGFGKKAGLALAGVGVAGGAAIAGGLAANSLMGGDEEGATSEKKVAGTDEVLKTLKDMAKMMVSKRLVAR